MSKIIDIDIQLPVIVTKEDAPIKSISVNGEIQPIIDGNVDLSIDDAPVQSISVNGIEQPIVDGNVDIPITLDKTTVTNLQTTDITFNSATINFTVDSKDKNVDNEVIVKRSGGSELLGHYHLYEYGINSIALTNLDYDTEYVWRVKAIADDMLPTITDFQTFKTEQRVYEPYKYLKTTVSSMQNYGRQYIPTDIRIGKNSKVIIKCTPLRDANSNSGFRIIQGDNTGEWYQNGGLTTVGWSNILIYSLNGQQLQANYGTNDSFFNNSHIIELGNFYIDLDGNRYAGTTQSDVEYNLGFGNYFIAYEYIDVYENDVLTHHLSPCKKLTTNEEGMYDSMSNGWYTGGSWGVVNEL